jgi:hypothetical protein
MWGPESKSQYQKANQTKTFKKRLLLGLTVQHQRAVQEDFSCLTWKVNWTPYLCSQNGIWQGVCTKSCQSFRQMKDYVCTNHSTVNEGQAFCWATRASAPLCSGWQWLQSHLEFTSLWWQKAQWKLFEIGVARVVPSGARVVLQQQAAMIAM